MKRMIGLLCLLLTATASYAEYVPHIGYELSSKGYASEALSNKEYISLDMVLAVKLLPVSIEAGVGIPLLGDLSTEMVLNAGIEFFPILIKDHPFKNWISLDSYYAPSFQISATAPLDSLSQPLFISSIHPLRFKVGGGYSSILSPGLIFNPLAGIDEMLEGWNLEIFRVGFYLW